MGGTKRSQRKFVSNLKFQNANRKMRGCRICLAPDICNSFRNCFEDHGKIVAEIFYLFQLTVSNLLIFVSIFVAMPALTLLHIVDC